MSRTWSSRSNPFIHELLSSLPISGTWCCIVLFPFLGRGHRSHGVHVVDSDEHTRSQPLIYFPISLRFSCAYFESCFPSWSEAMTRSRPKVAVAWSYFARRPRKPESSPSRSSRSPWSPASRRLSFCPSETTGATTPSLSWAQRSSAEHLEHCHRR